MDFCGIKVMETELYSVCILPVLFQIINQDQLMFAVNLGDKVQNEFLIRSNKSSFRYKPAFL